MAKINPVKLKQDADKLEKSGKLQESINLLKQVIDDNPRDWNVINKVGDLYAKLNKFREAAEQYAKVADFYAKDGFHLKAIAIWKKINKLDASVLEPYVNLAELYGKQGLMMEAKSQYQYVVDEYIKRGKMREAGEVLRKMADIDPADLKIRSKLADLYIREGNGQKAVEEHIAIADELNKKGHLAEALQVLEKGLKLDPKSGKLRMELARVHLLQKNWEKATPYLEDAVQHAPSDKELLAHLGEAYLGARKIEEAEAIFKRLLELDAENPDARIQMSRVYIIQKQYDRAFDELAPLVDAAVERKEGEKAVSLLQPVVLSNPSHLRSLNRLVSIYQQFGKESEVLSTYSKLTEAYLHEGQLEDAAGVLETLVAKDPQNAQHRNKLEFVRGKLAGGGGASAPAASSGGVPAIPDFEEEEFDLTTDDDAAPAAPAAPERPAMAPPRAAAGPAPSRPRIEVSGPLTDEDKEFIDEHLAEGKVFRKYGLVDKAADQFEAVVARFPDNAEARQELRDIHKEKGQAGKAAEQCLALAEIFRLKGDKAAAAAHEAEAERLAPGAVPKAAPAAAPAAPAKPAAAAKAAPPARAAAPAPPPPPVVEEEEVSFGAESDLGLGGEEDIPLDVEEQAPAAGEFDLGDDVGAGIPAQFVDEEATPAIAEAPAAEEEVPLGFDEFPLDEPVSQAAAPAASSEFGLEEEVSFGSEEPAIEEPPAPVAPLRAQPVAPPRAPAAPAAKKAAPGVPPELARVLEEIDSYVSLGFVDDAREALQEAAGRFPGHPALEAKIAAIGFEEAPPEPEAPEPAAPDFGGAEFDLGAAAPAAPGDDMFGELGMEEPPPPVEEPSITDDLVGEPPPETPVFDETPPAAYDAGSPEDLLGMSEAVPPPAPEASEGLDLGDELGELFGAQSAVEEAAPSAASTELGDAGLADIFKEFKKGVDKQLGKEDYDTRYNLGIAYKEMGLIDEAIAEFQLAAKDEGRLLECSSMLGICFMDKGMPKLAIKWFDKGLKVPGRTEEEYAGLRYDLATAFEASGDMDKALSLFTDLYGQDANFRDVATKVRELRGARS